MALSRILAARHNALLQLENTPCWYYFTRPSNMADHDLTNPSTAVLRNLKALLGLGQTFCPVARYTTNYSLENALRFQKDLLCKVYFSGRPPD